MFAETVHEMFCVFFIEILYSKIIYDEIRAMNPSGRFLKQDPKTKLWGDIGEKKALDKTRQALREGAPELLKELESGMEVDETTSSAAHNNNNGDVACASAAIVVIVRCRRGRLIDLHSAF